MPQKTTEEGRCKRIVEKSISIWDLKIDRDSPTAGDTERRERENAVLIRPSSLRLRRHRRRTRVCFSPRGAGTGGKKSFPLNVCGSMLDGHKMSIVFT
ncbi:hypothetical protein MHYP_G00336390 [Metynnis hypsauchen]